MIKVIIPCFSI